MDGRGGLDVDADQGVADSVVELVRQTQALLVEAVNRRRLVSLLGLLHPGFDESQPAAPSIPGREREEQQRQTRERRPDSQPIGARDRDRRSDDRGHRGADEERVQPPSLKPDVVQREHQHADRRDIGVEDGQARQEPGCDGDESRERIATAHDERQGRRAR